MNAPIAASRLVIPFPTDAVLIGGEWRAADGGATLALENPSDGSELARIARGGAADIDAAVAAARAALDGAWGRLTRRRARPRAVARSAARCGDNVEMLAALEALDVGKPLKQGRADAVALARYLEFYGGAATRCTARRCPIAPATPC